MDEYVYMLDYATLIVTTNVKDYMLGSADR